jgi:hypothetical protein
MDSDVFGGFVGFEVIFLAANELQYFNPDTFLGLPNIQYVF